jgi:hypothetical protein
MRTYCVCMYPAHCKMNSSILMDITTSFAGVPDSFFCNAPCGEQLALVRRTSARVGLDTRTALLMGHGSGTGGAVLQS